MGHNSMVPIRIHKRYLQIIVCIYIYISEHRRGACAARATHICIHICAYISKSETNQRSTYLYVCLYMHTQILSVNLSLFKGIKWMAENEDEKSKRSILKILKERDVSAAAELKTCA